MSQRKGHSPPDECANCGAEIPRSASACPGCGADERTGWRENADTRYDGLDLPESAFEDDATPLNAKRVPAPKRISGVPWYWWLVGVALLVSLVGWALGLS